MKKLEAEIGWSLCYYDGDQPRRPRNEKENQYLDELVEEHTKDEAYAGEFAQFVIHESKERYQDKRIRKREFVEQLAKKLRSAANELINRIVDHRGYKKQLISLAVDFGIFCMVVDARSSVISDMKRLSQGRGGLWKRRYDALKQACFDNGIFGTEGIREHLKGTKHAKLFKSVDLTNPSYFSSFRKEYQKSHRESPR